MATVVVGVKIGNNKASMLYFHLIKDVAQLFVKRIVLFQRTDDNRISAGVFVLQAFQFTSAYEAKTINATDADVVVSATPCDIGALIDIDKPVIRARYEFAEVGEPGLATLVEEFLNKILRNYSASCQIS